MRGRLAEADVTLACLVTWAFVALDRLRTADSHRAWRWAFFALLGMTSLVKGLGFGAALILSASGRGHRPGIDRPVDGPVDAERQGLGAGRRPGGDVAGAGSDGGIRRRWACGRCTSPTGWRAKPEVFIGGPWWQYGPAVLLQAMPWTPIALMGAWPSMRRAWRDPGRPRPVALGLGGGAGAGPVGGDGQERPLRDPRLAPVVGLGGARIDQDRGLARRPRVVADARIRRAAARWLFGGLGLVVGVGYVAVGPRLDRSGRRSGRRASRSAATSILGLPLVILYEDYDRKPYPTPFGPVPHDWAVRLVLPPPAGVVEARCRRPRRATAWDGFVCVARLGTGICPALRKGWVGSRRSPEARRIRFDRTFTLFRVTPGGESVASRR